MNTITDIRRKYNISVKQNDVERYFGVSSWLKAEEIFLNDVYTHWLRASRAHFRSRQKPSLGDREIELRARLMAKEITRVYETSLARRSRKHTNLNEDSAYFKRYPRLAELILGGLRLTMDFCRGELSAAKRANGCRSTQNSIDYRNQVVANITACNTEDNAARDYFYTYDWKDCLKESGNRQSIIKGIAIGIVNTGLFLTGSTRYLNRYRGMALSEIADCCFWSAPYLGTISRWGKSNAYPESVYVSVATGSRSYGRIEKTKPRNQAGQEKVFKVDGKRQFDTVAHKEEEISKNVATMSMMSRTIVFFIQTPKEENDGILSQAITLGCLVDVALVAERHDLRLIVKIKRKEKDWFSHPAFKEVFSLDFIEVRQGALVKEVLRDVGAAAAISYPFSSSIGEAAEVLPAERCLYYSPFDVKPSGCGKDMIYKVGLEELDGYISQITDR